MCGRRRFGIADRERGCCAVADGNADRIARDDRRAGLIDADVECDECNELYRVGSVDWHQGDVGFAEHGCVDR